jgi:hypothetical protein
MTDAQALEIAMRMWRNDDLSRHPKGSCAGCHGADFFDLARIGATDSDLTRRAVIDGATTQEAQALVKAVRKLRTDQGLPAANARSFRPLQPGGAVLLPNLTDSAPIAHIKRDIAFAEQLQPLLPTLYGERIDTLAKAVKAREELMDLARGTNAQGANPRLFNLRKLPSGIVYPLWSADLFHGKAEGTFNDWTADIAHDARPEKKAEWHALQDAYLKAPNNENFWRMYFAARDMTRLPLLGACTLPSNNNQPQAACGVTDDFNKNKFLSAVMGQHMMRLELAGTLDTFAQGPIAFDYLDKDPKYRYTRTLNRVYEAQLPAPLWEIGDFGRSLLLSTNLPGSFRDNLRQVGYPEFAVTSVDTTRTAIEEEDALRLAWFWIGFTFDSSFGRINKSNATKVGEYMVGTLQDNRLFSHNAFSNLMRLATVGTMPEAVARREPNPERIVYTPAKFMMEFGYFWAYNRPVLDTQWNEDKNFRVPADLKTRSEALWGRMTGNGFRMAMLLQMDAIDKGQVSPAEMDKLREWTENRVNTTNGSVRYGGYNAMYKHFQRHHPASLATDAQLINQLTARTGTTTPQW